MAAVRTDVPVVDAEALDPVLISVSTVADLTGLHPSTVRERLIKPGLLPSVKVGDRTLVPYAAVRALPDVLMANGSAA